MTLKTCISIFHELMVDILQNEIHYDLTPHQATLMKDMLSKMEFKMSRSEVDFHVQRNKSLQDFLDELWIKPSCEWIDSTDFWPKLPPLMRRNEMKQTNSLSCYENLFNIHSNHPKSQYSGNKYVLLTDEISQLCRSKLLGKTPYMPLVGVNYIPSSILTTLNSYNFQIYNPIDKDYSKLSRSKLNALSMNAEFVSLIDKLGYSSPRFTQSYCISSFSSLYLPYCMKNELKKLFTLPKLMYKPSCSSIPSCPPSTAKPSFRFCHFPITSSVCFPPSFHCCLENILLDCFEAIAPLCTKWCISEAFQHKKILEVLKYSIQCEDIQIKEVACKVLANLSNNELFVKFATENGIIDHLEPLVENKHFGVKIAAVRAYLNILSSAERSVRNSSRSVANHIKHFLSFSNSDGTQPKYNEGIYPIPNATNLNGSCGIDIITGKGKPEKNNLTVSPSNNLKKDECIESSVQNVCTKNSEKTSISVTDDNINKFEKTKLIDIVLVHGILGGASWTWRQHDSMKEETTNYTWCWPRDWLQEEFPDVNFRVISVNYPEPGATDNQRSLKLQGESLKKSLLEAGIGQRPVFWICHSRGGLLLKAIFNSAFEERKSGKISENLKLIDNSVGVFFLSTPHLGAPFAPLMKTLKPSILELSDMNYKSDVLMEMNNKFEEVVFARDVPIVSVVDRLSNNLLGYNFKIVPEISANPGFGEVVEVDENHLNICKPKDKSSEVYRLIVKFLRNNLEMDIPREI